LTQSLTQELNRRVTQLEDNTNRLNGLSEISDRADLLNRLSRIENDLASIRHSIPDSNSILQLSQSAQSAEKLAREITSHHESSQAMFLALGQLRAAINRGDPFSLELSTLKSIGGDGIQEIVQSFEPYASKGISTNQSLINRFYPLSESMMDEVINKEENNFWHKILMRLSKFFIIRRVDGGGYSAFDVMGRAEKNIQLGKLEEAANELRYFPILTSQQANQWIEDVKIKIDLDKKISKLETMVIEDASTKNKIFQNN
jgi:hypothetical protein